MVVLQRKYNFPNSVSGIPENYNFEIAKTLFTIEKLKAKKIALQFPDGLLSFAPILIDTFQSYFDVDCTVLGDVVYGACCADDRFSSDLLLHYGHSCLIPVTEMDVRTLYIFVDVKIDVDHLYKMMVENFKGPVAIIGTVQFNGSVNRLKNMFLRENRRLEEEYNKCNDRNKDIKDADDCKEGKRESAKAILPNVPQIKPLSPGELLGCTSPLIKGTDTVVYIGDGRFHLESAMIRNPTLNYYKYCPFSKKMTKEFYLFEKMKAEREGEIKKAFSGRSFGVILGNLGRQGNKKVYENVVKKIESFGKYKIYKIIEDEINATNLDKYFFIDSFVQVSCTRLSTDWGINYKKPLLSPMELFYKGEYHMDYYSKEGDAPWKNYNNEF